MYEVSMDKHFKYSPKHSLLARQRNKTASRMLEEQLKYMEQKYCRTHRQFLRDRARMQSELREIEDIGSEYDEATSSRLMNKKMMSSNQEENNHFKYYSGHQDLLNLAPQRKQPSHSQKEIKTPNNVPASHGLPCPHLNNNSDLLNSRRKETMDEIGALKIQESNNKSLLKHSENSNLLHRHMTSFISLSNNNPKSLIDRSSLTTENKSAQVMNNNNMFQKHCKFTNNINHSINSNVLSNQMFCKYTTEPQSRFICHHFPCVLPTTYHTISHGINEPDETNNEKFKSRPIQSLFSEITVAQDTYNHTLNDASFTARKNTSISDELTNPRNKNVRLINSYQSNRSANNNLFIPIPPDPILERIRNGLKEPGPFGYTKSRTTVRDKIRGLNLLAREIHAKNDSSKPQDWIVNYGQHLPSRILLNPAMPGLR